MEKKKFSTKTLTLGAVLTAIVIILQFLGAFIHLGPFSISLVLVPIVIGAAMCGRAMGAWLGFVFGVTVLASGDAAAFLTINAPATVLIVLVKGALSGFFAAVVYKALAKINTLFATIAAAIVCPIVNTGVFLLGCFAFFWETMGVWAEGFGFGDNVVAYMILGLVGANFLFELGFNIVLSPAIVRLLKIRKK